MSSSTFRHLAYLQQISDVIEDDHKQLAAKFGHISKKIAQKHLIHISGKDAPKLRRCKACYAPITKDDIITKNATLVCKCALCGLERKYPTTLKDRSIQKSRQQQQL